MRETTRARALGLMLAVALGATLSAQREWRDYAGGPDSSRYVAATQITKANVSGLKEVWRFETPDGGRLQTTPLVVDGTMYVVSPRQKVIALDAATGSQKWTWDSGVATTAASRGLTSTRASGMRSRTARRRGSMSWAMPVGVLGATRKVPRFGTAPPASVKLAGSAALIW